MSKIRSIASRVKTRLYRKPKDELHRLVRRGPRDYIVQGWTMRRMAEAAGQLPIPSAAGATDGDSKVGRPNSAKIWFLTGKSHWYQTAFCAWTFQRHSRHSITPVLLDDGTMDEDALGGILRLFPSTIVHTKEDCDVRFGDYFPKRRFPNIHRWRQRQLLFRKLTDIHAGSGGHRLFFDSDMLFFREPVALDQWLESPGSCLAQRDCWESYGYSRELTELLCGVVLPDAANIGVFSLDGSCVDWEEVERWLQVMEREEGTRYNVTQCTSAMLMAQQGVTFLDREEYKVIPSSPRMLSPDLVLGHFVSDSKAFYAREALRLSNKALSQASEGGSSAKEVR